MSIHDDTDNEFVNEFVDDLVTLISRLDMSNPLHLYPNDSTALTVVSIKLKGENYQIWSCAMLLALEGKNKIGYIDGSCRRYNNDDVLGRQWERVNAVILGWILNSISEEIFMGQFFSKRAKHVLKELKETYDKVDGFITFGLHHKIHTLIQNGSSIIDYYHMLNALWKQFDAMIDSILSREVLPDVRSVYATISSEESHKVDSGSIVGSPQRNQAFAFVSNVPNRNNFQRNQYFNN
ncbi:ribonuclease H-like domain-containing protein [Tanacetum coccineum]